MDLQELFSTWWNKLTHKEEENHSHEPSFIESSSFSFDKDKIEELGITSYDDLSSFEINKELVDKVPYTLSKKHLLLPVKESEELITIATANPFNIDAIEELRLLLGKNVEPVYVQKRVILDAMHTFYRKEETTQVKESATEDISEGDFLEEGIEVYDLLDSSKELSPAVQFINFAISEAIRQGASDIHFEPQESKLLVRYRIDGSLQNRHSPSQELQTQILTRLKVMAKMDIAEKRLPQDGRIKMRLGGKVVDFRMSTLPTVTGERIVLRILDKGNIVLGLDHISMPKKLLDQFRNMINSPEGIILVTGPTGSGKTTTLYSAIAELKNDDTNIMTIEDPVEYRLKDIAQIGVQPKIGLTFAAGLRHILRQDPDIIMIGEIRDKETAEIAIQAALTGHLVISTLHTNDAPSAIARLVDMGVEPYLISSCVIGVLAQRLVRKICPHCKIGYEATPSEQDQLDLPSPTLFKGQGCPKCFETGFLGRQGIFELMPITNLLRKQLLFSPDASELQKIALESGLMTLRSHGKALVAKGVTTFQEVWRATKGQEDS